nr:MAG TPA: hypothetical protein [Caudoviricetes sp.]
MSILVYTIYRMIGGCYYGKDDAQKDRQEMCSLQELERCHGQHHDPAEAGWQFSGRDN